MKHYLTESNELFAFEEDGSQDHLITSSMKFVTNDQADAIRSEKMAKLIAASYDYKAMRAAAFREEAEPLFFKYQRGEATREEWEAKCQEIRLRYPVVM